MDDLKEKVGWEISVPIFRSSIILKQMGMAIGIPFGGIALVIGLLSDRSIYTLYGLGLIGALFFLTWVFIMVVYGGKYEAEFVLDDKGVLCRTQAKQMKKNRIVNALTAVLGLLSGKPSVSGAGMMAQSRQEVFLEWDCVRKVKYKSRNHTILLRGGFTENIALFCTMENYDQIEQIIQRKTHLPIGA